MRREPLSKAKGLLEFHTAMGRKLALARRLGNVQTAKSYLAALVVNAKEIRRKLLYKKDGTRI